MSEILFYHLEHQTCQQVLPQLLDKTLARGWRAVVQAKDLENLKKMSEVLWGWRNEAFLAHGISQIDSDDTAVHQPIWLCCDDETPNNANVRFCIEGVTALQPEKFERIIYLFDGNDEEALEHARKQWKDLKQSRFDRTYWQQSAQGKWEKKA